MSKQEFEAEKKYLLAVTIAKNLREKGLLTEEEYREIDTKLRAKYGAKYGRNSPHYYSRKTCYVPVLE